MSSWLRLSPLLLLVSIGCVDRSLYTPRTEGDLARNDDLRRPDDLARPTKCTGLDEASCATSNCLADYCPSCGDNPPYFLGCRRPDDPQAICPPIDCVEWDCHTAGEQTCATLPNCQAAYCESCDAFVPIFVGCFFLTEPLPICEPTPPCQQICRSDGDCGAAEICQAPGDPPQCGACAIASNPCAGDFACATDEICEPLTCACNSIDKACVPGCKLDSDCGEGMECEQRRCRAKTCSTSKDCPALFVCSNFDDRDHCTRKECKSDKACGKDGFCVEGRCFWTLGVCEWLVD